MATTVIPRSPSAESLQPGSSVAGIAISAVNLRLRSSARNRRVGRNGWLSKSLSGSDLKHRRRVPEELWGAWNAVRDALGYKPWGKMVDSPSTSPQIVRSSSSATFIPVPGSIQGTIEEDLDFRARLSGLQVFLICLVSASLCGLVYVNFGPSKFNIWFSLGMAALFAASFGLLRFILIEKQYKGKQRDEASLGDADSSFAEIEGACIHFKCKCPDKPTQTNIHLYHGFGANLTSWQWVIDPLSRKMDACVTAHDTPAFGLTQRPKDLNGYSLTYNGRLGRKLCEQEAEKIAKSESEEQLGTSSTGTVPKKLVLVGHSMGGACAALEASSNPSGISAIVLVAPAVFAPTMGHVKKQRSMKSSLETLLDEDEDGRTTFLEFCKGILSVMGLMVGLAVRGMVRFFLWCSQPFLVFILRFAVRSRRFWERGLANAYSRQEFVQLMLNMYRFPQLVRGWEWGLVRFVRARLLSDERTFAKRVKDVWGKKSKLGLAESLIDVASANGIKVLIIHGEKDRLVPVSNSRKLASVIPNSELIVYPDCGHMPHEEQPDRFVHDISNFVETL